jgi:hypothetical protein
MDLLLAALGDKVREGTALAATGEDEIEGRRCRTFSFGANTPEKFTAEEHYAVTDDGEVFVLDILENRYVRLEVMAEEDAP